MNDNIQMEAGFERILNNFKRAFRNKQFSYSEAISYGLSSNQFYKLKREEVFENVAHGIYRLNSYLPLSLDEQLRDATQLLKKQSSVCLLTALSYYGLSDEIITQPQLLVDYTTTTRVKSIKLFRSRNPFWDIGIINKGGFNITNIERTIIDCIAYKNTKTGYEGIYALNKAIKNKSTTIKALFSMAKELNVSARVDKYLEAHLSEA